jgi:glycosyltransferase involved in cell wall biosynthesis
VTRLVVVDATPYGPGPSGARRRLAELLPRLAARMPQDVFEVHWARDGGGSGEMPRADNVIHATVDVSCRGGVRRWARRRRDLLRRHRDAPFTHLLVDHGPVVLPERVANVVTLHDLRFLHGYGGWLRSLYARTLYGGTLRSAAAVVAVSPSVAREATARFGLDPRRVVVAPNAAAAAFRRGDGLLVVARDEPRKARGAALAVARELGRPLRVVDGGLSDDALADAYRCAAWLLAPSLDEGFDLPVVEALACGTPVVASDIPAHRDLLAAGAVGLVLVPPPVSEGAARSWPMAADSVRAGPPAFVSAPPLAWEASAAAVEAALRGRR